MPITVRISYQQIWVSFGRYHTAVCDTSGSQLFRIRCENIGRIFSIWSGQQVIRCPRIMYYLSVQQKTNPKIRQRRRLCVIGKRAYPMKMYFPKCLLGGKTVSLGKVSLGYQTKVAVKKNKSENNPEKREFNALLLACLQISVILKTDFTYFEITDRLTDLARHPKLQNCSFSNCSLKLPYLSISYERSLCKCVV